MHVGPRHVCGEPDEIKRSFFTVPCRHHLPHYHPLFPGPGTTARVPSGTGTAARTRRINQCASRVPSSLPRGATRFDAGTTCFPSRMFADTVGVRARAYHPLMTAPTCPSTYRQDGHASIYPRPCLPTISNCKDVALTPGVLFVLPDCPVYCNRCLVQRRDGQVLRGHHGAGQHDRRHGRGGAGQHRRRGVQEHQPMTAEQRFCKWHCNKMKNKN